MTTLKICRAFYSSPSTSAAHMRSQLISSTRSRRKRFLLIFPVICAAMGSWQIHRHFWKQDLKSSMNARLTDAPVDCDPSRLLDQSSTDISTFEHKRIRLQGQFLHDFEMLVGPRNKGGSGRTGYYLYTPLLCADGSIVIVNRGWIPKDFTPISRRELMHRSAVPDGLVRVHGMLRRPATYQPSFFLPSVLPKSSSVTVQMDQSADMPQWLWIDMDEMAAYIGDKLSSVFNTRFRPDMIVKSFFVEEVIDPDSQDDLSAEMLRWFEDTESRETNNSQLPGVLANLKAVQMDPMSFSGKPIIPPASVTLPDKHMTYVVTWFSLAGLLLLSIFK